MSEEEGGGRVKSVENYEEEEEEEEEGAINPHILQSTQTSTDHSLPVPPSPSHIASNLTSLIDGILQQTQSAFESFLPTVSEIEASSVGVAKDLEQAKALALQRKSKLEEEKETLQQAAYRVLEFLNATNNSVNIAHNASRARNEDSEHEASR